MLSAKLALIHPKDLLLALPPNLSRSKTKTSAPKLRQDKAMLAQTIPQPITIILGFFLIQFPLVLRLQKESKDTLTT